MHGHLHVGPRHVPVPLRGAWSCTQGQGGGRCTETENFFQANKRIKNCVPNFHRPVAARVVDGAALHWPRDCG